MSFANLSLIERSKVVNEMLFEHSCNWDSCVYDIYVDDVEMIFKIINSKNVYLLTKMQYLSLKAYLSFFVDIL